MKSKTKTILICAAILAAVFLIAFLDGGAVGRKTDVEIGHLLNFSFVEIRVRHSRNVAAFRARGAQGRTRRSIVRIPQQPQVRREETV